MTETKDIHIRELQKMVAHFRERAEDLEMMLKGAIQRGGELIAERDRYREAFEALRPYIRHHRNCYKGGNDNATVIDCVCGLDAILSA